MTPSTKDFVEAFLKEVQRRPALAAVIVIFFGLNALVGLIDKCLGVVSRLGITLNPSSAPRLYATTIAGLAVAFTVAYKVVRTAMQAGDRPFNSAGFRARISSAFEHSLRYEVAPVMLTGLLLNISGAALAHATGNHIFLDTLGTFVVAFVLGPFWGGSLGVLSNTIFFPLNHNTFIFGVINASLGILWGYTAQLWRTPRSGTLRAWSLWKGIVLWILPATLLSSYVAAVIKTSIYDPMQVRLFYENGWALQQVIGKPLLDSGWSLRNAYFLGDLARNTVDKALVAGAGLVLLATERSKRRTLPLSFRSQGPTIVFVALYACFLYFALPFEYVTDRATGRVQSVHLTFGSWLFMSLPLYIGLLDWLFYGMGHNQNLNDTKKHTRVVVYQSRLNALKAEGILRWLTGAFLLCAALFASYAGLLRWAAARASPDSRLDTKSAMFLCASLVGALVCGVASRLARAMYRNIEDQSRSGGDYPKT